MYWSRSYTHMPHASTTPLTSNTTTQDCEPVDDTTEHSNHDLDEHEEGSHDADSKSCFDEIPEDNPEDELEPLVDNTTRATHKADNLFSESGITWWIFRQSQDDLSKTVEPSLSPIGTHQYQPSKKNT